MKKNTHPFECLPEWIFVLLYNLECQTVLDLLTSVFLLNEKCYFAIAIARRVAFKDSKFYFECFFEN